VEFVVNELQQFASGVFKEPTFKEASLIPKSSSTKKAFSLSLNSANANCEIYVHFFLYKIYRAKASSTRRWRDHRRQSVVRI
jgi:hypothetical protein